MKKILMTLAVALGFAAIANADFISGTSFERYLNGGEKSALLNTSKDDLQGDTASFWEEGPTDSFVTNDTSIATDYTDDRPAGLPEGESTQYNYLVVDATTTLNRLVDTSGDAQAIGDGFYFDSLVKFTVADAPDLTPESGDKLVVWMQAIGEEEAAQTNLVVTAGYLSAGNASSPKSYVVATDAPVLPETWHRLTIKAIADIGNSANIPGFVVFIDGKPVTNEEDKGASGSVMDSLNATAGVWAGKNALFPSLVVTGESAQSVTSVGFKGSGAVDDLVFTTTAPAFAADGTYFTLNWTPAAFSALAIDGTPVESIEAGTQSFVVDGTEEFSLTYELNTGYKMGDPEVEGAVTYNSGTFTVSGTGSATLKVSQTVFMVNGEGDYATFADALAAANDGDMINVCADVVFTDDESYIDSSKDVILDLGGHNLSTTSLASPVILVTAGTLTIVDSVGGGKIMCPAEDESGAIYADGTAVVIGREDDDEGVTLDGLAIADNMSIVRGNFISSLYTESGAFAFAGFVATGSVVSDAPINDYWVVAPGDAPVTYAVTWDDAAANATAEAMVKGVVIKSGDKFVQGTEVSFVVTPEENYTYDGVELGTGWTLEDGDIITATFMVEDEDLAVEIPAATEKQVDPTTYTVTWSSANVLVYAVADDGEDEPREIISGSAIDPDEAVTFFVIPTDGYVFETIPDDWEKDEITGGITKTYMDIEADLNVQIPAPSPETYTITYEGATVTNGVTQYTIETETFALPTAADVEERVGGEFKGWTNAVSEVKVTEVTKGTYGDLTFYAVWESAGEFYPDYINPENADLKQKFNDWATKVNGGDRDTTSANLEAYLLNCKPDQVETEKAKFKITSITKVGEIWEVKVGDQGQNGEYGNGYINIISVRATKFPTAGNAADFFQATLVIQPVYKDE